MAEDYGMGEVLAWIATLRNATTFVVTTQYASTRALRRHLRVSQDKASIVIATLEERGIVGPPQDRAPSRHVLVRAEDLETLLAAEFPFPGQRPAGAP